MMSLVRIHEDHSIMSFSMSKDGRLALLNIATQVEFSYSEPNGSFLYILLEMIYSCYSFQGCSSMGFT
jgi:hypothetical protein